MRRADDEAIGARQQRDHRAVLLLEGLGLRRAVGGVGERRAQIILSAVIFNALIIIALVPLALRGVKYTPKGANAVLFENVMLYGVGGIIVPFIGIKLIDMILGALHLT